MNTGALKLGGVPPEVLFLERAWRWAKPGTGRIAILLPDGLLGNPGDEYVRWWILRHCEVLASVDLPVDPFKVTLKDYRLTPALPSLLVLRRRSDEELRHVEHPDYWVFMAVVDRAGVDARGNLLFERAPDGEELIFDDEVVERVRIGGRHPYTDRPPAEAPRRRRAAGSRGAVSGVRRRRETGAVKEKLVPSAWLVQQGRRLDCGPYLSGAVEAKLLLRSLPVRCAELRDITHGHDGGIYNGPQFVRNYVSDPAFGVPFLSSSSMLHAEFHRVDLLRKSNAVSRRLAFLQIEEGTTLISCSGTIGRMAYARPEISGMWSSQHVLKVVPDPNLVRSGYLYAFLSGRFGVPLVVGGTYGAIVQHIEPGHISDLPVPLAPEAIQDDAHRLVAEAAEMRTLASAELRAVTREIEDAAGLPPLDIRYASARPDTIAGEARVCSTDEWTVCSTATTTRKRWRR